ncbi:RNA polymerase sigma factor [Pseudobacter ginsenosidimutans]|uniref:RNA polymerase sigma-70 factor (ECF subfamily) n=1 Tax=Pseudobacter ginsenosidimutans TaxID=661488 RepID=A0A4Q7MCA9_9BACT|nr:RNA polymerase sigma-70 factor [Pseudobacter ginsenosidimutans]QEC42572.1 RNA polymerase sigma-70 factor [Pseudobacter ginsenosidimutans]RZS63939.1 RNA polymerase sigma-70 factor (ECF subfamily) [Pseudobacter ginsenosidimutans]
MQKAKIHNSQDEDLLLLWQNGNAKAFDELFRRYFQPLCQYAFNNLQQSMLAEELVMDVMMRIWKTNGQIHCPAGFRPYILRALKNAILNHFRSSLPAIVSLEDVPAGEEIPAAVSPDHKLLHDETRDRYLDALSSLSDKKREVFILSREESLTYKEIARQLNISVNTVENYISASLSHVKEKMK